MAPSQSVVAGANKPEGRSVCLRATITLSKATGVTNRNISAQKYSTPLPVGSETVRTEALGGRAKLDSVLQSETVICVEAWNTGKVITASRERANPSHAEAQLIKFMWDQQQSDNDFYKSITAIEIAIDFSPCSPCAHALTGLLRDIRAAKPLTGGSMMIRRPNGTVSRSEMPKSTMDAVIRWKKLYENRLQGTTWHDLLDLNNVGWKLISPHDARPLDRSYHTDLVRIQDA